VLNSRTTLQLARLFDRLKLAPDPSHRAYFGGPVSVTTALALMRSRPPVARARPIAGEIHLVANRELMEKLLSDGADSSRFRIYLGYAGWSPGQLERETNLGAWHIFDADASVVFDPDPDTAWRRLIRLTELPRA
jgi:putative transcriptional regulator